MPVNFFFSKHLTISATSPHSSGGMKGMLQTFPVVAGPGVLFLSMSSDEGKAWRESFSWNLRLGP